MTIWIDQRRAGDARAAQKLWERYFHRLVVLARGKRASDAFEQQERDRNANDNQERAGAGAEERDQLWPAHE